MSDEPTGDEPIEIDHYIGPEGDDNPLRIVTWRCGSEYYSDLDNGPTTVHRLVSKAMPEAIKNHKQLLREAAPLISHFANLTGMTFRGHLVAEATEEMHEGEHHRGVYLSVCGIVFNRGDSPGGRVSCLVCTGTRPTAPEEF